MKRVLTVFCLYWSIALSAQNSVVVWQYADISYMQGGFSSKTKIDVDFGNASKFWKTERLQDSLGNDIKFKSPVDALNWMSERGWELVQSYTNTERLDMVEVKTQHFIVRRKKE